MDIAKMFADKRQQSKQKRAANRNASKKVLQQFNVQYQECNNGAHLIIQNKEETIDFFPGTGLFIVRNTDKRARGIKCLILYLTEGKLPCPTN